MWDLNGKTNIKYFEEMFHKFFMFSIWVPSGIKMRKSLINHKYSSYGSHLEFKWEYPY